jgi:hypothetical protein
MTAKARGFIVSAGGLAWLAGIVVVESMYTESDGLLPVTFLVLALCAGVSVGWGLWSVARSIDLRIARLGSRLVAASASALGVGFGLELLPSDTGLGFLLAYTFSLFVLPIALVVLGLGVQRSVVFPGWAKWVPPATAGAGVVTYGFHALAPEIWDPSDAVWYLSIGVSWVLLGLASLTIPYGAPRGGIVAPSVHRN